MSSKLSHEFEALQRMYGEQYDGAKRERRSLAVEAFIRRLVAYGFKLAAVLGGIAVASGLNEQQAHQVGIGIAVVVGLDLVFSNHKRLLITAKAAHAYRWSLSRLATEYNLELKKHPDERDTSSNITLLKSHITKTQDLRERIAAAVNDSDLKFLEGLAVQDAKTLATSGGSTSG